MRPSFGQALNWGTAMALSSSNNNIHNLSWSNSEYITCSRNQTGFDLIVYCEISYWYRRIFVYSGTGSRSGDRAATTRFSKSFDRIETSLVQVGPRVHGTSSNPCRNFTIHRVLEQVGRSCFVQGVLPSRDSLKIDSAFEASVSSASQNHEVLDSTSWVCLVAATKQRTRIRRML